MAAVNSRLRRMGKRRAPYRLVVMDSRKKRDGRAIEEIGKYHPTEEPSLIDIASERAQYWIGVGAQPSEQVLALLKITGGWQQAMGLPGPEATLRTKEGYAEAAAAAKAAAVKAAEDEAEKRKAKAAEQEAAAKAADKDAPAEESSDESNAGCRSRAPGARRRRQPRRRHRH